MAGIANERQTEQRESKQETRKQTQTIILVTNGGYFADINKISFLCSLSSDISIRRTAHSHPAIHLRSSKRKWRNSALTGEENNISLRIIIMIVFASIIR